MKLTETCINYDCVFVNRCSVCNGLLSHSANTLGKGMNSSILLLAIGKHLGSLGSLILVW